MNRAHYQSKYTIKASTQCTLWKQLYSAHYQSKHTIEEKWTHIEQHTLSLSAHLCSTRSSFQICFLLNLKVCRQCRYKYRRSCTTNSATQIFLSLPSKTLYTKILILIYIYCTHLLYSYIYLCQWQLLLEFGQLLQLTLTHPPPWYIDLKMMIFSKGYQMKGSNRHDTYSTLDLKMMIFLKDIKWKAFYIW